MLKARVLDTIIQCTCNDLDDRSQMRRADCIEISRFPSKERPHMPVSKTTPGRLCARVVVPIRVAFRHRNDVGTRDEGTFAAQWLAYAPPCQRFANTLAASAHDSGSMWFATPSS
jgi:hypothetical protein